MCKYVKDDNQDAPYPRVSHTSECGFRLVLLEGYEFDSRKDCGGSGFSERSNRIAKPTGKCMKCKEAITA